MIEEKPEDSQVKFEDNIFFIYVSFQITSPLSRKSETLTLFMTKMSAVPVTKGSF